MKTILTLEMGMETKRDGIDVSFAGGFVGGYLEKILNEQEIEKVKNAIADISDVIHEAVMRDIKKELGIEDETMTHERVEYRTEEEIRMNELVKEAQEFKKELEKEMDKMYQKLNQEEKARIDAFEAKLKNAKNDEEKDEILIETLLERLLEIK